MAWCLLPVLLLLAFTSAGDILSLCETKEARGSSFALYPSDSTRVSPCECNITSEHIMTFIFKRNAGVDNSYKSGDVTLRSMNGDKKFEVLLVDREEVNGSRFLLIFPNASLEGETRIDASKTFALKCSPKIQEDSNSTNSVSNVVIPATCAVAWASVLFGIIVVCCFWRTRRQRLPPTDEIQDNLYDTADHLLEPPATSSPTRSRMTYSSCDHSGRHSANTAVHTNTTPRCSTAFLAVSEAGYDTPDDTVQRLNSLKHTEGETYITLNRDCSRREDVITKTAVYDQCQPPGDTDQGSGDHSRPLEDTYCRLQRGQQRQPVIGNIYDTTSAAVTAV